MTGRRVERWCGLLGLPPDLMASAGILRWSDRLEVPWIHAVAHSAEVVQVQGVRDRANRYLVGEPMGAYDVVLADEPTDTEATVAAWSPVALPGPAGFIAAGLVDLGPEPLGERRARSVVGPIPPFSLVVGAAHLGVARRPVASVKLADPHG